MSAASTQKMIHAPLVLLVLVVGWALGASAATAAERSDDVIVVPRDGQVEDSGHVEVRVRAASSPSAIEARLNGVDVGDQFGPGPSGQRSLDASVSAGLRRGENVLRVTARDADGVERRETVRFDVRTTDPLVGAGVDQRIPVGGTIELEGIVRPGAAGEPTAPRWSVEPGGREAGSGELRSPDGLTAKFTPLKPGRYTIELDDDNDDNDDKDEDDDPADTVQLTATPGPLVSIKTAWASGESPGMRIDGKTLRADVPASYSGIGVQIVDLDRATLRVLSNKTYTLHEVDEIPQDLGKLDPTHLVAVAQYEFGGDGDPIRPDLYTSIGVTSKHSLSGFSAIGVPGMNPGEAYQRDDPYVDTAGGTDGYLLLDQHSNYAFAPALRIPFSYGPQPGAPCQPCSPENGFRVTIADALTGDPVDGGIGFFSTNGRDLTAAQMAAQANAMASFLHSAAPGSLVTVESVTNQQQGESESRAAVGPIDGASMTRLADAIASVGGTHDVFNRAALQHGTAAVGQRQYTLVGWDGGGEGNGEEAGAGINGAPASPTLSGILRPNRQSQLRPSATTDDGAAADTLADMVMQRPSDDWMCGKVACSQAPGVAAAISYLGLRVSQLGSDPRAAYGTHRWDADQMLAITSAITAMQPPAALDEPAKPSEPGKRPKLKQAPKFDSADFATAKAQLLKELGWVANVRGYMQQLSAPFSDSQLPTYIKVQDIADAVFKDTQTPKGLTAFDFLDLTKILLALADPITGDVSGEIGSLIDLGQWASGTTDKGKPTYADVKIEADQVATRLVQQTGAIADQLAVLGDVIVSDPKKLGYFGPSAGCNPSGTTDPPCPPALAWSTKQQELAAATLSRGIERYAYQQLMPLGYGVFKLNMQSKDAGIDTGHQGPWSTLPDTDHYKCGLYYPFSTEKPEIRARWSTSVAAQVDPSLASSPNGMWYFQSYVLAQQPGSTQQHADGPPADVLKRMFNPVSDGGLGMVPQELMSQAKPSYWEYYPNAEKDRCWFYP
jgi:hypothetical protein